MIVFSRVLIVLNAFFTSSGMYALQSGLPSRIFRAPARRQLTAGALWRA